jgi:dipeptidyl aminopeptidase/acylaminoacyl peptidase
MWKRLKLILKWPVRIFGILMAVLILFIVEENIRGKIALHSYLRQLHHQGEKLSFVELGFSKTSPPSDALAELIAAGKELETLGENARFNAPAISVDGRYTSYNLVDPRSGKVDIWIRDITRRISSRFTVGPGDNTGSIWSPDGSQVVFSSTRTGQGDLFVKPTNGHADETLLLGTEERKTPTGWSRDGRYIAYQSGSPTNKIDLWALPTFGDRKPIPVVVTAANESNLTFSPDGRFVAYGSDQSGTGQIYVQSFPTPTAVWQVSNAGGVDAVWRADGKELIYRAPDQRLMAVEMPGGEGSQPSVPHPLFLARLDFTAFGGRNRIAVMPDGQRFILISPPARGALVPTTVVLNWAAELK